MRTTLIDVNHPERGPIDCDWQIATVARQAVQGFAQKLYIYIPQRICHDHDLQSRRLLESNIKNALVF